MNILEKELEDIIFNSPKSEIEKRGLSLYKNNFRQVPIGGYGIADMISWEKGASPEWCSKQYKSVIYLDVIELKKDEINLKTLKQAFSYLKGIERYKLHRKFKIPIIPRVTLIGSQINTWDNWVYMLDYISIDIRLMEYTFTYKGIEFNQTDSLGWYSNKECFSNEN